jgi:hypothetical protein
MRNCATIKEAAMLNSNPHPQNFNEIIYGTSTPFAPENRFPERTVYVITPEQARQVRQEQKAAKQAQEDREAASLQRTLSRSWDQINADVAKSLEDILAPYRIAPEIAVADPRSIGSWGPGTGTSPGGQYGVFGLPLKGAAKLAEAGQQGMSAGDKWFRKNVMQAGADEVSNYANRFGIELSPEAMESASLGTGALMGLTKTGGASLGGKVLRIAATALGIAYAGQAAAKGLYNLWSSPTYYDIDTGALNNILGSSGVEVLGQGKNATAMLSNDMISKLDKAGAIKIRNAWDPVLEGRTRITMSNNFTLGQIANPFSWNPKQPLKPPVGYSDNTPTPADSVDTVDVPPPPQRPPSGSGGRRPGRDNSGRGNIVSGNSDNTAEPFTGEAGARTSNETRPIVTDPSE